MSPKSAVAESRLDSNSNFWIPTRCVRNVNLAHLDHVSFSATLTKAALTLALEAHGAFAVRVGLTSYRADPYLHCRHASGFSRRLFFANAL